MGTGWYFVLGFITGQILRMLYLATTHILKERRDRKFLRLVNATFPDSEQVTVIAVDTSDRRAFKKVEKQLREDYGTPQEKLRPKA